jgi:hypothetical protein
MTIHTESKKQNVPTMTAAAVGFLLVFLLLTYEVVYLNELFTLFFV